MRAATKRAMAARVIVMTMRVAGNEESKGGRVMAMATWVVYDEEGNVDSSKSTGNKGGGQATASRVMATAMLTTWVMATGTRLVGNKEGKSKGGEGDDNGYEGGG